MKNINEFLAVINLCDNNELETLTSRCNELLKERKIAARNALRQELMTNLQTVLSDILHNGFSLIIKNTDLDPDEDKYTKVYFEPEDGYSIHMKQRFAATLILY